MKFELPPQPEKEKIVKLTIGQRKILADKVRENAKMQIEVLRMSIPDKPNLENFLVQQILNGELELKSAESIKGYLADRVRNTSRKLIDYDGAVEFNPQDIFVIPDSYNESVKNYQVKYDTVRQAITTIMRERDTICMKIEVGSPEVLSKLVREIDQIGGELSLSGMNASLLIGYNNDHQTPEDE